MFRLPQYLSVISLSLFLAACGGGGGDTNSSGATGSSGTTNSSGASDATGSSGAGTPASTGTGTNTNTSTGSGSPSGSGNPSAGSAPILASTWTVKEIPHARSYIGTYYQDVNDSGDAVSAYIMSNASGGYLQSGVGITYGDGRQVELGTLQWATARGTAINNAGQLAIVARDHIVGPNTTPYVAPVSHSHIYTNGSIATIPAPSFAGSDPATVSVFAQEMNNSGKVVGYSTYKDTAGATLYRAFVYANGARTDIPLLAGASSSRANAISDTDIIVGNANLSNGAAKAFIYRAGAPEDLGTLPGFTSSTAADVNDRGQVAGTAYNLPSTDFIFTKDNNPRPFLFSNGAMTAIPLPPGYNFGQATGINNQGQVVGSLFSEIANAYPYNSAFLYSGGRTIDLNQLPEVIAAGIHITGAEAINNNGQILVKVGSSAPFRHYLLSPSP